MTELDILVSLQDQDSILDALTQKIESLPERVDILAIQGKLESLETRKLELFGSQSETLNRQKALELEVDKITQRVDRLTGQLKSGAATNLKDQLAVSSEIENLIQSRSSLEDDLLRYMDEIDRGEHELAALSDQGESLQDKLAKLTEQARVKLGEIEQEIEKETPERTRLASEMSPGLLTRYEKLRAKLGGVAVSRVIDGKCTGCHLSIPVSELEQISHSDSSNLRFCEQCGRIAIYSKAVS